LQAAVKEIEEKKRKLRPLLTTAQRAKADLKHLLVEASEQADSAGKSYVSFENH